MYLPVPRHLGTMPGIASVSTHHHHRWKKQFDEEPEQRTKDLKDLLAVHPIQKTGNPLDATKEVGHYSTRMPGVKVQEKKVARSWSRASLETRLNAFCISILSTTKSSSSQ